MIVYEFWLREQFKAQAFDVLCNSFYNLGKVGTGKKRKVDEAENGACVYSVSRNENTHWVQILVDDNTPQPMITAIEARINGLKDDEPFSKYVDDMDNSAPIETPKHFSMDRVLSVRQRQKGGREARENRGR